jgi:hypothetical protein
MKNNPTDVPEFRDSGGCTEKRHKITQQGHTNYKNLRQGGTKQETEGRGEASTRGKVEKKRGSQEVEQNSPTCIEPLHVRCIKPKQV